MACKCVEKNGVAIPQAGNFNVGSDCSADSIGGDLGGNEYSRVPNTKAYQRRAKHGQGVRNVEEREVGREEWGRHWVEISNDGSMVWEDAESTAEGEQQAEGIAAFLGEARSECLIYFQQPIETLFVDDGN
ncbi:phosphoglycerate mutase [Paraphaeosphaeria minitans]|uniref:Phosphoglycerate mutase n=1 Tax=Paraphaeosphaeria minitans TaxID=565426 RepID=A0A9P6GFH9_9PLEO|nr:phosphoglycerate mutase [Paraphaeosphaeria minitans]